MLDDFRELQHMMDPANDTKFRLVFGALNFNIGFREQPSTAIEALDYVAELTSVGIETRRMEETVEAPIARGGREAC
jgi:hypothetical protein